MQPSCLRRVEPEQCSRAELQLLLLPFQKCGLYRVEFVPSLRPRGPLEVVPVSVLPFSLLFPFCLGSRVSKFPASCSFLKFEKVDVAIFFFWHPQRCGSEQGKSFRFSRTISLFCEVVSSWSRTRQANDGLFFHWNVQPMLYLRKSCNLRSSTRNSLLRIYRRHPTS